MRMPRLGSDLTRMCLGATRDDEIIRDPTLAFTTEGTDGTGECWIDSAVGGVNQTNLSVSISINGTAPEDIISVATTNANGWSETGWVDGGSGFSWSNTYTRAAA